MADFPIQYSQRLPSGRSTAAPITADVAAPSRALSQAGGVLAQFGQKIQQAEDAMEFSTLKRQSEEIWNAAYNTMLSTPDPESRAKVYEKAKKDMSGLSAKSRRVQDKFQMHLNNALPQYDVYAADLDRKKRIQSAKAELETNGKYYLENGDLLGYQSLLKDGLDTGLLEEAEYQYMQENAETNSKFAQVRVLMDSNPQMAVQILDSMPDLTGEQLDQKDKLIAKANNRLDITGSEANKDLADVMVAGNLTVPIVQSRRNQLKDTDYEQWLKIAFNKPDKPGNPIEAVTLESAAIDIWRGAISREEFDRRVRDSIGRPDGINEKEYSTIMQKADSSLKLTQAEDLRRFSRDAGRVILEKYSGLLQFDASGNIIGVNLANLSDKGAEEAKYRFHFLSLYEQGLRDWLAENPQASGKEFYQFAREQKVRYWNTSLEQIKAIAEQEKRGVFQEPEIIPTPKTKADFDKLPSGAVFFAPDGTKRRKP